MPLLPVLALIPRTIKARIRESRNAPDHRVFADKAVDALVRLLLRGMCVSAGNRAGADEISGLVDMDLDWPIPVHRGRRNWLSLPAEWF